MKGSVSKTRTKKTRSRERLAGRPRNGRLTADQNPTLGLAIGVGLWLTALLIHGIEEIILNPQPAALLGLAGDGLLLLLGTLSSYLILTAGEPAERRYNSMRLLLAFSTLVPLIAAKALLYAASYTDLISLEVARFALPFVAGPLLVIILVDPISAAVTGIWTALAFGIFAGRDFTVLITGLVATAVVVGTAYKVRTRSKVLRAGLAAGIACVAPVFCLATLSHLEAETTLALSQAGASIASGIVSALIVLLLLPLFEMLFKITSNITLLELSDLGHPLLQKMALEAPGTYHHSLVVASLAQAAADEIGANSLVARVCSYFHDVGKLVKPDFFTENIRQFDNPHDDLPPSMSALVISSHVKEGLSLAMLHKLPTPVMRVIQEHHGTSLMSWFHHKAMAQMEEENLEQRPTTNGKAKPDEANFRYQGPRPTTRESAIIALADSVEAASRSMEKKTTGHIENLVDEIVKAKLLDGQLENSRLTLAELTRVKMSFVFTLGNMLHDRVSYPKDESRSRKQAVPSEGKQEPDSQAGKSSGRENRAGGSGDKSG